MSDMGLNPSPLWRWVRFVVGGLLNTGVAYVCYLGLNPFLDYQLAFLIAYVGGVAFSYFFNSKVVFRARMSWGGFMTYPLVYLIQYAVSALALGFFVEKIGIPEVAAPIIVAVMTLPLTYILSKAVILQRQSRLTSKRKISNTNGTIRTIGWEILLLPSVAITAVLWFPFGFSLIGLIEEWDLLGLFNTSGLFFRVHSDGPVALHAMRPFMPLTFATAYVLDRDSFTYWHVLMFISLVIKGGAVSYLLGKVTQSRFLAVAAGVLVLVYPADTMQLSFRSLHINWASALALLAVALLYASLEATNRRVTYVLSAFAAVAFFHACGMYEAALTLWPLPLLLLWVRYGTYQGFENLLRKPGPVMLWLMSALAYGVYAVLAAASVSNYQSSLTGGRSLTETLLTSMPKLFSVGALRAIIGGWVDAVCIFTTEYTTHSYILAGTLVIAILAWLLVVRHLDWRRAFDKDVTLPAAVGLRLAAVGLTLTLLGYAPFLLSSAHLMISQRTFIWATPGAAMVWLSVLFLLARSTRAGAAFAAVALTILGLSAQLYQFHHYVKISETQRSFLKMIAEKFDGDIGRKTLIVIDGTSTAGHTWMFPGDGLLHALSYLYGHQISAVEICHRDSMEWQRVDNLGRKGTCVEDDAGWTFQRPSPVGGPGLEPSSPLPDRRIDKGNAVVVSVGAEGDVSTDAALELHRANLDHGSNTIARRYRGVLNPPTWPFALQMFKDQVAIDQYRWDFGDYWSLEIPMRGSGWREAEWQVSPMSQNAIAWKTREDAQVHFDLTPRDAPYRLIARFPLLSKSLTKEQMRIRLNGVDLALRWLSEEEGEADIPQGALKAGRNILSIRLPTDPNYYGLSIQMDRVEVVPR
jgi:putative flippase GtrA